MNKDYNKWFGNRIHEILDEKGMTQTAVAAKSGITRQTIGKIIAGRYAAQEELQKIASALEISIERLKQTDVDLKADKRSPLKVVPSPSDELRESLRNVDVALGNTERGLAYQTLGASYMVLQNHLLAIDAYRKSFEFIKSTQDPELAFEAFRILSSVYLLSDQLDLLEKHFDQYESELPAEDERALRRFLLVKASTYSVNLKKYAAAIEIYLQVQAMLTNKHDKDSKLWQTRVLINIADTYFYMGDYVTSATYYDQWYANSPEQTVEKRLYYLGYCKDYAKSLFAAGRKQRAITILDSVIDEVKALDSPDLLGHYYLLYALIRKDANWAERVLQLECKSSFKIMASLIVFYKSTSQDACDRAFQTLIANTFQSSAP